MPVYVLESRSVETALRLFYVLGTSNKNTMDF
jgi:hypothetical protein